MALSKSYACPFLYSSPLNELHLETFCTRNAQVKVTTVDEAGRVAVEEDGANVKLAEVQYVYLVCCNI